MTQKHGSNISLIYTKETTAYQRNASFPSENTQNCDQLYGEKLTETKAPHAVDWDDKKATGQYLGKMLRQAQSAIYGDEVVRCSTELSLQKATSPNGERWRVRPFSTCKRRWCPVCEWKKSRERLLYALSNWSKLVPDPDAVRVRFLTLTVKNCTPEEVADTVGHVLQSFRKLLHHKTQITKNWLGYIRTLELTHNPETGMMHPHMHIIFLTPKNDPRAETSEWVQAWRKAAKLGYDPVCDIRAVKSLEKGLAEVLKYTTKPAKIANDAVTLALAIAALKGRRLQQAGGCLKGIFEPVENEPLEWQNAGNFDWRAVEKIYRRRLF